MCGGDFDGAGSELAVHENAVADDGDRSRSQGEPDLLADQVPKALIFGMHRHRRVAEQGFRACGSHEEALRRIV